MVKPRNKPFVFMITFSLALTLFLLLALVFFYFHCTCYSSHASFILVDFSLSIKKTIGRLNSNLEEYRGEILEPSIGNLASLFYLSWPFVLFILIIILLHLISITLIHSPSRCTFTPVGGSWGASVVDPNAAVGRGCRSPRGSRIPGEGLWPFSSRSL